RDRAKYRGLRKLIGMPSHGSITKAGKVRSQTPKLEAKPRKSPFPRQRNRYNYFKRVVSAASTPKEV
ncbi:MAG: 30S ribosomal protein S30e, partial [Candidatus Caldarchaeum sp.]|nr:30S ribosomal protein S30e [Candidatus Caldarchaeum sp.]